MFKKSLIAAAGAIAILSLVIVGCSSDDQPKKTSVVNQVIDEIADSVVDNVIDAQFTSTPVKFEEYTEGRFGQIGDVLVADSVAYAVFDGGFIIYDLADGTYNAIASDEKLNAVSMHKNQIFVGGNNLFVVKDGALATTGHHFELPIMALESFDGRLMIGTGQGLYSMSETEYKLVRENIPVSAMAADETGLWVGTDGCGLFRMEGDDFKKRYLLRDTSIFNDINCLDYNRGFLYAGTDDALYIHDGGSWATWTVENDLPSNTIRDIDASGWVVYIATDAGVTGYFDNNLYPARTLENKIVNVIQRFEDNVIAGTDREGLLMKSGGFLKTLVEPGDLADERVEAVEPEVIDEADAIEEVVESDTAEEPDATVEAAAGEEIIEVNEVVALDEAVESEKIIEPSTVENSETDNATENNDEGADTEANEGEVVDTFTAFEE